jgi:hypothetical protein
VKTDHLITRILKSELSDASKAKLGSLINIMNSDNENARYKPLIDGLKTDKTIQLVFDYTEMPMQTNAQLQYAGYLDTAGVMRVFSISRRTLNIWCKKRILRATDFGGKNYFCLKDIEDLFLQNYTGTSAILSAKNPIKK